MNWLHQYRLDCELNKEVYQFISNCEDSYENHSLNEKKRLKREKRLEFILESPKVEFEPLEYLNRFLDDFIGKIKFVSMPVGQFMYLDTSVEPNQFKSRNIAVASYSFENYNELKEFLDKMIIDNKCYVFSYKLEPQPTLVGNKQKFNHVLRNFFVNDNDIKEWNTMEQIKIVSIDEL
jgi:hypothetical protein